MDSGATTAVSIQLSSAGRTYRHSGKLPNSTMVKIREKTETSIIKSLKEIMRQNYLGGQVQTKGLNHLGEVVEKKKTHEFFTSNSNNYTSCTKS